MTQSNLLEKGDGGGQGRHYDLVNDVHKILGYNVPIIAADQLKDTSGRRVSSFYSHASRVLLMSYKARTAPEQADRDAAYREAFQAIASPLNVMFGDSERKVLDHAFTRGRPLYNQVESYLLDVGETRNAERIQRDTKLAQAFGFQMWLSGAMRLAEKPGDEIQEEASILSAVRGIFDRVQQTIQKTFNLARGRGFATVGEVFQAIKSGRHHLHCKAPLSRRPGVQKSAAGQRAAAPGMSM